MTKSDVRRRVIEVRNAKGEPENASELERNLHEDVLKAIAEGYAADPAGVARVALETRRIRFSRWPA